MNAVAFISFLVVITIVAATSWLKVRKRKIVSAGDLLFAGKSLNYTAVGTALFFTNISAAEFIGGSEAVYLNNMTVMAWGVSSVFAMLLVAEFIIPIYLRGAISTTPDFLESRYDKQTKTWVSCIFLISYLLNLLPIILYSGAIAINGLFHFSDILNVSYAGTIWMLVWCIGLAGSLYAILGGLKAIVISDMMLGICLLTSAFLLAYFGLQHIGNGDWKNGVNTILSSKTAHLNAIGNATDTVPFSTIFTGMLLINLFYWGTEQVIVQQALAARNLQASQKGIVLACVGKLLGPFIFLLPGIIAVHLYNPIYIQNTTEVFPRLISDVSPPVISGFIAAVVFGAAITAFSQALNSSTTLFILNFYKPYKQRKNQSFTDASLLKATKRFEVFASLLAMFVAPLIIFSSGGFYTYMQKANAVFSIPIFTIMFVGFVSRKIPPVAAKAGLIFCVCGYLLSQIVFDTSFHFLHVLALLFLLTVILMLVIGKLYPNKTIYSPLHRTADNLKPWKNRHVFYVFLLSAMILLFILFSKAGIAG